MVTENLEKLYLELSQFLNVKTEKEVDLERLLRCVLDAWREHIVQAKKLGHSRGFKNGDFQLYNRAMKKLDSSYVPDVNLKDRTDFRESRNGFM